MSKDHVKAKKHLGQHFLNDQNVISKIAKGLTKTGFEDVIEVGPGTGVITKILIEDFSYQNLKAIEIDQESIAYLNRHYPDLEIIEESFLDLDLSQYFKNQFAVVGNFPYYISTQILFKILDFKELVPEVVGMFQKEVAERVCAQKGNKTYGIISVLIQAYYETEYLFTVPPSAFTPPPKIDSGVIRLKRKENLNLNCDDALFKSIVKMAFNQRRKVLNNSIKALGIEIPEEFKKMRAEQLSVDDFVKIAQSAG